MLKELLRRLLDANAAAPDFADLERRLQPRRGRFFAVAAVGAAALAVALLTLRPSPDSAELTLYIARTDRPASEALEIHLRDWRKHDPVALFGAPHAGPRLAGHLARNDLRAGRVRVAVADER